MSRHMWKRAAGVVLTLALLAPAARADTITWNVGGGAGGAWDTGTANWTGDAGGRNDNLYVDGDAVTFDDTGAGGTISLTAARAPSATVVSGSALYTFTGSGITNGTLTKSGAGTNMLNNAANSFSGITLGGGELHWADTGRLGTGVISVTANATLRSTKTAAPAYMGNSGIAVSDGVTLNVYQHNPNNQGATSATLAPISGGSAGSPITVNLYHTLAQGRVRMSPSTFVGSFYARSRILYEGLADSQFGHSNNVVYIVGGLETYQNIAIKHPVVIQGGFLGGGPLIFDGPTTNTGSPQVVSTIRFNNAASSLGGLYPNGGTVEFAFLPTGGSSRADGGGNNGTTFRFLGDLAGNASFGISKNYDFSDGVANGRWMNLDVPSVNADVTLTAAVAGYSSVRGGFRKDGAGTLTLANAANNSFGALQVRAGRLNVTGTLNGVSNVTVQTGATLGGTGTLNLGAANTLTLTSGSTLSPGVGTGTGTLTANTGTTALSGAVAYDWDVNATTNDRLAAASLNFSALTAGTLKIRIASGTTRKISAQNRLTLFTYTGAATGFDGGAWSVTLAQEGLGYRLAAPQIAHDSVSKTVYLTGLESTPRGTVIAVH